MKSILIMLSLIFLLTYGFEKSFSESLPINEEKFRTQSVDVFSVVDSSVGIIRDPDTGLTIVDLGSFYGIGGNGTVPDTVKVYRNNILWKTTTKETGIVPSTSHSEWQIPQTFFFNELPGKYKLSLITNNTETLVFEFIVSQITDSIKSKEEHSKINLFTSEQKNNEIPNWFKANLRMWNNEKIEDKRLIKGIELLTKNKFFSVSDNTEQRTESLKEIPNWFRKNITWWLDDQISDKEIISAFEYMIEKRIIRI